PEGFGKPPVAPGSGGSSNQSLLAFVNQAEINSTKVQPFLKWAGGKAQLLKQLDQFFPESIARYIEPFLGGGAVFFYLKARFPDMQAQLCDNNPELINCYKIVRDEPGRLMELLDRHLERF